MSSVREAKDDLSREDLALRASRPVLLLDTGDAGTALSEVSTQFDVIEIPLGVSRLGFRGVPAVPGFVSTHSDTSKAVRFELCTAARSWILLLFVPPAVDARVNGAAAAPVTPLVCGDVLRVGAQRAFSVSELRSLVVEPPPDELLGRPCALCGVPLESTTTVHVCACGAARHMEDAASASREEPLQCLRVGSCPECASPVPSGGLRWSPAP